MRTVGEVRQTSEAVSSESSPEETRSRKISEVRQSLWEKQRAEQIEAYDLPTLPRTPLGDAARATLKTMGDVADFTVSLIPYSKYVVDWKNESEAFMALPDKQAQVNALLWDALGAAAYVAPAAVGNIWKTGWRAVGAKLSARQAAKTAKYDKPLEDIKVWTSRDYWTELDKALGSGDFGFPKAEREAVFKYLQGDQDAPARLALRASMGKADELSEAFEKTMQVAGHSPALGAPQLHPNPAFLDRISPAAVRQRKYLRDYGFELNRSIEISADVKTAEFYRKNYVSLHQAAFQPIMEKVYGKLGALGKSIENATPRELAAAREWIRTSDAAPTLIKRTASPGALSAFGRYDYIFGRLEATHKVKSRIKLPMDRVGEWKKKAVMNWNKTLDGMLTQRGLLKVEKGRIKATSRLTPRVAERARDIWLQMENLTRELGVAETAAMRDTLRNKMAKLLPNQTAEDLAVRDLVNTVHDLTGKLHAELVKHRLFLGLNTRQISNFGKLKASELFADAGKKIDDIFSTGSALNPIERNKQLKAVLDDVLTVVGKEAPLWYDFSNLKGQALQRTIERLRSGLQLGKGIPVYSGTLNFPYKSGKLRVMKIMHEGGKSRILTDIEKFYGKVESLGSKHVPSLEELVMRRVGAQADYMYVLPAARQAAKAAKYLPPKIKRFVEGFISAKLHMPSRFDASVAQALETFLGPMVRGVGQVPGAKKLLPNANWKGVYDSYDVMQMGKFVNDLTYMAYLGGRPFSVMRNYFQPLLMVPSDLGGIKDVATLSRSYLHLLERPALRAEIDKMGVIPSKFVGEYTQQTYRFLRTNKRLLGMPVPGRDQTRDALMFMFSKSHEHNCYVSAAAAILKWDDALKAVGKTSIQQFAKKAGLYGRDKGTAAELLGMLERGSWDQARTHFVRSVVRDTQYIYAAGETPGLLHSAGAAGRSAFIFQSWWINYANSLHKWATTSTLEMKASRALNFVASGYLAGTLMEQIWDKPTAWKAVLTGPFPEAGDLLRLPPAGELAWEGLRTILVMGRIAEREKPYSDATKKQLAALAKQTIEFAPAGLQITKTVKRTREEGTEGFFKSLIRYKKSDQLLR